MESLRDVAIMCGGQETTYDVTDHGLADFTVEQWEFPDGASAHNFVMRLGADKCIMHDIVTVVTGSKTPRTVTDGEYVIRVADELSANKAAGAQLRKSDAVLR